MFSFKPLVGKYGDITDKELGIKNALYEYNPGKQILPGHFQYIAQKILDSHVREDDVWTISFPKTGSTWCQEMVWLMGNNLDFDRARSTLQLFRAPVIEASVLLRDYKEVLREKFEDSVDYVESLPSPRFIKTHLSYHLLPTQIHKVKPKIIYTIRNPKDVCVSYYHHCKLLHNFNVEFEVFCELFLADAVALGGLFEHYLEFWNRRHEKNILVLRYEDMKRDTRGTLRTIAEFMEKNLSEKEFTDLEEFLSFKSMRENKGCNFERFVENQHGTNYCKETGQHIFRKGEVGDWKNHMSPEMSKRFDEWIEKKKRGTDLVFDC